MLKILTGEIKLSRLDLSRDFAGLDDLMESEEWPFSRADVELSHAQPLSTSYVARKGDRLVGFFTTHNFGEVGYLDMMIVDKEYRKAGVAKALYLKTVLEMKRKGLRKFVVHTTNDSFPLIRFLRFRPGPSFTLLARSKTRATKEETAQVRQLGPRDIDGLVRVDAATFGCPRPHWIRTMLNHPEVVCYGLFDSKGEPRAALCLRPRKEGALCLDAIGGSDEELATLVDYVSARHPRNCLECFVRTDSTFHRYLISDGFEVPTFFKEIGPLVEWRKGDTGHLGAQKMTLSWL